MILVIVLVVMPNFLNLNIALKIETDHLFETKSSFIDEWFKNRKSNDDYLDRHNFNLGNSIISYRINDDKQVPLIKYEVKSVVKCLDLLSMKRNRRPMHIAFVGDSTVRQHFLSFLNIIPDNDRMTESRSTTYAKFYFHEDRNVTSRLFDNLLISFYWRRLMADDLIDNFKRWANDPVTVAPDIILLGVTAHHIGKNEVTNTLEEYEKRLEGVLLPLIKQSMVVHSHLQVIWLNQSPTIDYLGPSADMEIVHAANFELIQRYNHSIRRIFKDSKIIIWDSINTIVEEYLRSCALTRVLRKDKSRYLSCNDFIHPGYGALSIGTQLFVNHLCATA